MGGRGCSSGQFQTGRPKWHPQGERRGRSGTFLCLPGLRGVKRGRVKNVGVPRKEETSLSTGVLHTVINNQTNRYRKRRQVFTPAGVVFRCRSCREAAARRGCGDGPSSSATTATAVSSKGAGPTGAGPARPSEGDDVDGSTPASSRYHAYSACQAGRGVRRCGEEAASCS